MPMQSTSFLGCTTTGEILPSQYVSTCAACSIVHALINAHRTSALVYLTTSEFELRSSIQT